MGEVTEVLRGEGGHLVETGIQRITRLENIQPDSPFVARFVEENPKFVDDLRKTLSNRRPVKINLETGGGQGEQIMCRQLKRQLVELFPALQISDTHRSRDSSPDFELKITADAEAVEVAKNKMVVPLELARMILPVSYSDKQVAEIDALLGLTSAENNLALTCVKAHEVDVGELKRTMEEGCFDRVIIIPHDMQEADLIWKDLTAIGMEVGKLSEGKTGAILLIDVRGIAATVLQSTSIGTSIVGRRHNPTETLMAGARAVMFPEGAYQQTIDFAQDTRLLFLVGSDRTAWDTVRGVPKGASKDFRFRDKVLETKYEEYEKIIKTVVRMIQT